MMKATSTLLMALALCAVPSQASKILSFDDCVTEVAMSNPEILAARTTLSSAQYQLNGAYSNFYPQISGLVTFEVKDQSKSTTNGWSGLPELDFRQNLFSGFLDKGKVDIAKANLESSKSDYDATRARISLELKTAFAGLLYAQDLQHLSADILARTEANYKLVSLRFKGGNENMGSKLLSLANFNQAQFSELQAQDSMHTASIALAKVLGRNTIEILEVNGNIPGEDPGAVPDFEALALQTPAYKKAQAQEKAAVGSKTVARASFLPSVDLGATLSAPTDFSTGATSTSIASITVSLPIFNGGANYNGFKSAIQNLSTAAHNKFLAQVLGTTQLANSYYQFVEAVKQVEVSDSFLTALSIQEKIAKAQYNDGLLIFTDWDRIETDYITRQNAVLTSKRGRVIAQANWENARGLGVIQ